MHGGFSQPKNYFITRILMEAQKARVQGTIQRSTNLYWSGEEQGLSTK